MSLEDEKARHRTTTLDYADVYTRRRKYRIHPLVNRSLGVGM